MTKYDDTRRGKKEASRGLKKGATFYTKVEVSQRHAPYEDSHLLHEHKVTGTHPLLGGAMVRGHSVEQIMNSQGPAYTDRNHPDVCGVRCVGEPAPQVAPPLAYSGAKRPLNAREIREMEEQVANDLADRHGMARGPARRKAKDIVAKRLRKAA